jgi:AAA ATPase domain
MTATMTSLETAVFAGRAAELSALKDAIDGADSGRFSAVMISGEPGIGKTRLTEEACHYSRELGFTVVTGHCFDTQRTVSYYPFVQAFRQLGAPRKAQSQGADPDKRKERRQRPGQRAGLIDTCALAARSERRTPADRRGRAQGTHNAVEIISRLACAMPHPGRLDTETGSAEAVRIRRVLPGSTLAGQTADHGTRRSTLGRPGLAVAARPYSADAT